MNSIDSIKKEIQRLYESNPSIHISVKLTRPRLIIENAPVKIIGVYNNIFQIEENRTGHLVRHTLQYSEVLTGNVKISELS